MTATLTLTFGDAFEELMKLPDSSLHAIITDPPYFLDGMGDTWADSMVGKKTTKRQTVSSLRSGMRFDKKQGQDFQKFMHDYAIAAHTKLKPGGWFVSFSAPRLYHRLAVGVEDAGYEVRDMWQWLYTQNQMKAMSVARQLESDLTLTVEEKDKLLQEIHTWKTPQVKSNFEPILIAQKPREGTFYNNWKNHGIGLVNVYTENLGDGTPATSNVITTDSISETYDKTFLINKPSRKEKGNTNHLSVKPLKLMEHLIEALIPLGGTILDPFMGSGTTGLAALNTGRKFIGFENNPTYYEDAKTRIAAFSDNK